MLNLRKIANELGWEGAMYVITGVTALAFATLDLIPIIKISNEAMLRLAVAALGILAGAATSQAKKMKEIVDASKRSSVELIEGEEEIYRQSIVARDQLQTKILRTTGLAYRRSFSRAFQGWLDTVDHWLDTRQVTQHLKVIRIVNRSHLETVANFYENSKRHGKAELTKFIRPEETVLLGFILDSSITPFPLL